MGKDYAEYRVTLTAISPWKKHKDSKDISKLIEALFRGLKIDITDIEVLHKKVKQ